MHLVVIQHSVQILNPYGIDRTIKHNPSSLIFILGCPPPKNRKNTIRPVPSGSIHSSKHLWCCDCLRRLVNLITRGGIPERELRQCCSIPRYLGVHAPDDSLLAHLSESCCQAFYHCSFASARWAHKHDTMAYKRGLI